MITEIENRRGQELKKNLYFIRHGQSEANITLTGGGDPSLTKSGVEQAIVTGNELKQHFDSMGCAPVAFIHTGTIRSMQTLEKISEFFGSDLTHIKMADFQERGLGEYEKKDLENILKVPELAGLYEKFGPSCVWFLKSEDKGIELLSAMYERIKKGVLDLRIKYESLPIIVIGHAGSMKIARRIYESDNAENLADYLASFVPNNCEIYKLG
ncbi:MAG: hypothetical protein UR39_C0004G0004 [Candidatus Woesebacteria bacterium GW2011_GWA1_33_30]|uniref:Phosphoglycerate mutase n=1 Tax=Candidatus Woesebacteria bacterium GW2011_GWA2_33_28 TaxID=1618561 RepID=A0A0G0A8A7_9BACT|nr:MAG: hypothetical protein UR38_C0004G0069 [Candidatus Woesebacteria bacterium GW2011_GWA2_33_28]KKP48383.1 MAG: hypothetical protein UR39_C0004G0004 [Candidatus Woesebacteria bacterium GW2011_GWA1_33_30]KKP49490.1 MAG: hypothetical protein UR40_C0005G0004 [Microgenomates group bacterium GW2011_GWC1_33_32]KKP52455.1 MAG: hypothetical protein UR44_C0002G0004 [Candidatus Woesebacteria bacterium GW2011_GWB1_33_38]KKP57183.1 MAG: hypothetical protein UR48_C0022G0004 [Microgenomates group bacteriu